MSTSHGRVDEKIGELVGGCLVVMVWMMMAMMVISRDITK
jgi:hypothetical protein